MPTSNEQKLRHKDTRRVFMLISRMNEMSKVECDHSTHDRASELMADRPDIMLTKNKGVISLIRKRHQQFLNRRCDYVSHLAKRQTCVPHRIHHDGNAAPKQTASTH